MWDKITPKLGDKRPYQQRTTEARLEAHVGLSSAARAEEPRQGCRTILTLSQNAKKEQQQQQRGNNVVPNKAGMETTQQTNLFRGENIKQ